MQPLYQETIGPALVSIAQRGDSWIVRLKDGDIERERTFSPTAYDDQPYEQAIRAYDDTCNAAARIHNAERPTMGRPDFVAAVNS